MTPQILKQYRVQHTRVLSDFGNKMQIFAQLYNIALMYQKDRKRVTILKEQCHAVWQLYKNLERVFASTEFQN